MMATLDVTGSAADQANTIKGLRAELKSVQAQLASSKDSERELRGLLAELRNCAEGEAL